MAKSYNGTELTKLQLDVLRLVHQGYDVRQIMTKLNLSSSSLGGVFESLRHTFGTGRVQEAAATAKAEGII